MNLLRLSAAMTATLTLIQPCPAEAHHGGRHVTATVYAASFHGRPTACGQTYSDHRVSAAHPWLPCGTRVRVSHRGRSLVVPVTDRCDCESIDLSYEAARRLGVPTDGTAIVRLQEL
jgi:rare lipoprotein A